MGERERERERERGREREKEKERRGTLSRAPSNESSFFELWSLGQPFFPRVYVFMWRALSLSLSLSLSMCVCLSLSLSFFLFPPSISLSFSLYEATSGTICGVERERVKRDSENKQNKRRVMTLLRNSVNMTIQYSTPLVTLDPQYKMNIWYYMWRFELIQGVRPHSRARSLSLSLSIALSLSLSLSTHHTHGNDTTRGQL